LLGVSYIEESPFVDTFHKTSMVLTFIAPTKNRRYKLSKVWLVGLDRPESAEGLSLDFAWLDEAGLVPKLKPARQSIMRRLRGSGMAIPFDRGRVPENAVGMWVTTTPPKDGLSSDLYYFFEHPRERNPESKVYRMSLYDNKENLPPGFVEEMERTHTGALGKRYIEGFFVDMAIGAFAFDYSVHVENFWEPHLESCKIVYGVDFGWTNQSAIVAVAFDGDGRAFVLDEFYERRMSPQALVNECLLMQSKYGQGTFWCDASRPDNIAVMSREGLDARANKSKRDDGIAEMGGRFPDAGDGFRRLYINRSCVNLAEELQIFNPDRKEHDHAVDALRYAVMGGKGVSGGSGIQVLTGRRAPW